MLHAMCDVNGYFQGTHIEKTYPESTCRSAGLMALAVRAPPIKSKICMIEHLTDMEFLTESLAMGQPYEEFAPAGRGKL